MKPLPIFLLIQLRIYQGTFKAFSGLISVFRDTLPSYQHRQSHCVAEMAFICFGSTCASFIGVVNLRRNTFMIADPSANWCLSNIWEISPSASTFLASQHYISKCLQPLQSPYPSALQWRGHQIMTCWCILIFCVWSNTAGITVFSLQFRKLRQASWSNRSCWEVCWSGFAVADMYFGQRLVPNSEIFFADMHSS